MKLSWIIRSFLIALCTAVLATSTALPDAILNRVKESFDAHWLYIPGAQLSPDGRHVAYVEIDPTRIKNTGTSPFQSSGIPTWAVGSVLYIVDALTHKRQSMGNLGSNDWAPAWSPDGRFLAFFSDRNTAHLWIYDVRQHKLRMLPGIRPGPVSSLLTNGLMWSDDGRCLLVRVKSAGNLDKIPDSAKSFSTPIRFFDSQPSADNNVKVAQTKSFLSFDSTDQEYADSPVAIVDVSQGRTLWTIQNRAIIGASFMPHSHCVAYFQSLGERNAQNHQRDFEVHVQCGAMDDRKIPLRFETAATNPSLVLSPTATVSLPYRQIHGDQLKPVWSLVNLNTGKITEVRGVRTYPDGVDTAFALGPYNSEEACEYARTQASELCVSEGSGTIQRIPIDGGSTFKLAAVHISGFNAQANQKAARDLFLTGVNNYTKRSMVLEVHPSTGSWNVLYRPQGLGSVLGSDVWGDVLYEQQDSNSPDNLWLAGPKFRKQTQISNVAPNLAKKSFGVTGLLPYTIPSSKKPLKALMLYPVGYVKGHRYSAIECGYPGDDPGDSLHKYLDYYDNSCIASMNLQLFAQQGYVVIDVPLILTPGHAAQGIRDSMVGALNAATRAGIIDSTRVGVVGCSYSAFAAMEALIVASSHYAVGVEVSGPADPASFFLQFNSTDGSTFAPGPMENAPTVTGPPWSDLEDYITSSPVLHADRITAPLLIIQGSEDDGVSPDQGGEMFAALRMQHKRAQYVLYEGVSHCPLGPLGDRYDAANRTLRWLQTYLK